MKYVLLLLVLIPSVLPAQESILFLENFDNNQASRWTFVDDPEPRSGPGDWRVENEVLRQYSNIWSYDAPAEFIYHAGSHAVSGDSSWTNYSFNAILRSTDNDGIGIIFRYRDAGNYYRLLLMNDSGNSGSANSAIQRIQKFVDGEPRTLFQKKVAEAFPSGYFAVSADVRRDSIKAFLNGNLIGAVQDSEFDSGRIGLFVYANSGARFDSIMVTADHFLYNDPGIEITYPVDQDRQPYIQNPTINSVEIAWRSLTPATGSVEIGLEKGEYFRTISEQESLQKHHVVINNLEPDTRYFYRVKSGSETVLEDYSFKTAKPDSVNQLSFLVLGDSGVNTDIQRKVRNQMINSHRNDAVDFLIHVGDVHQGDGSDYDPIYFDIYQELLSSFNFYLSIGNHDTYTDNATPYLDDFYYPTNNRDSTERYYTYRWANSFFINIDSNLDMRKGSPQYQFIEEALKSEQQQTADWTFAYFHHPPYCEFWPEWDGDDIVRNNLMPLFEEYDVDIVFNGHTHAYEVGELNGVHYVISGGGGGGLDTYARDVPHISYSEGIHHFSRVDIEGKKLRFKAVDLDGNPVDEFVIDKSITTTVEPIEGNPTGFKLEQNYPNPFNPETSINYSLDETSQVRLEVFDSTGRKIATLVNEVQKEGAHQTIFSGKNIPSGNYFYRLTTGASRIEKTMTLIK